MRAKTGSKYIITLSLILLLAAFLFVFALSADLASASPSVNYIAAEVTTSTGDFLPSGLVYDKTAVDLSFAVYTSEDRSSWTRDDSYAAKFELRFTDLSTGLPLAEPPAAVGSYSVAVAAKDSTLSDIFTSDAKSIVKDTVVGSASFSIYYQNLFVQNTLLDQRASSGSSLSGVGNLLLSDDGLSDFFDDVVNGTSVRLGGSPLAGAKYTVTAQYKNAGVFSDVTEIKKVGTYRLKVVIDSSVDLSCTQASLLEKDGDDYLFYREFSVVCETLTLSLKASSAYEKAGQEVSLSTASLSKLTSLVGSNYETELLYLSAGDGVGRLIAHDLGEDNVYHPTECGRYVYRVFFKDDVDSYGIKIGDYVDLPFEILPIPYVVRYYLDDDTEVVDCLNYNGATDLAITPVFYDLNGDEIDSVYTDVGTRKYEVTCMFHNGAGWEVHPVKEAGKYMVVINFTSVASVDGYPIPNEIQYVFRIVSGSLNVATTKTNYYLSVDADIPAFSFTSQSGDESAAIDAYTVTYFQEDGTLIGTTAPTSVGKYFYELSVTNAIDRLGVTAGATYRGSFSILYGPVSVSVQEAVVFKDGITDDVLLDRADGVDPDFEVVYYVKSGNIFKRLTAAPSEEGQYLMQVVVKKALPNYRLAVGDVYEHSFSIAASSALIGIDASSLDLVYDGGVKVPQVGFTLGAAPVELTPLVDYQIAYYRLDGEEYLPCDAPVLAGTYRFVVTYLKTDPIKGLSCGTFMRSALVLTPAKYNVTFAVSDDSKDLVYDAEEKTYDVSCTYRSRPVTPGFSVEYAVFGGAYGDDPFTDVGDYSAKVVLDDDKSGSLALTGGNIDFSIVKLSLKINFVVKLGYNRMWTGAFVNPDPEYVCLNGRYKGQVLQGAFGIGLSESATYYSSEDGIHYNTPSDPIMPGRYRQDVTLGNANVILSEASSEGDNAQTVSSPFLDAGVAQQTFTITPREVEAQFTYDFAKDGLYFTGSENEDRKGVSEVKFYAYKDQETGYSVNVTALFEGDCSVYYYTSDYEGVTSGEGSLTPPYEKSYYVARVLMEPDGVDDDYLAQYTFKGGKDRDGALGEKALSANCYVDDVFRIKDQNKLKVLFEMPETFAENDQFKTISVKFYNNSSEVNLIEGEGNDYKITYLDENEVENTTSFKTHGNYRVKLTFLKNNIAYRLDDYPGEYTYGNDYYIALNDTLVYAFEIFEQRLLNVSFTAPASLYYDATVKSYQANFAVSDSWTDCAVTLTKDTHYRLRYYMDSGAGYALIDGAPSAPGDYAVEVVFLKDLLDYKYGGKTILKDNFYSITESPSEEKVATPRLEFSVLKAVLKVGGVYANDKSFDGKDQATFNESGRTLSVKAGCGANVDGIKASALSGTLVGTFKSVFPSDEAIIVNLTDDGKYALPEQYRDYYELEYEEYSAHISKAVIQVLLSEGKEAQDGTIVLVTREYNPYSIESVIDFTLSYDEDLLDEIFHSLNKEQLVVGELSYEKGVNGGTAVGSYPIALNTLRLNDEASGAVYLEHPISDLFTLALEKDCYYRIIARPITVSVDAGQSKTYGDLDPNEFSVSITSGRLIYGDSLSYTAKRDDGESASRYLIRLNNLKVVGKNGEDVSSNYSITTVLEYFTINKRVLKISPKDQAATYLTGFSYLNNAYVLDMTLKNTNNEYGVDKTDVFLDNPPIGGDRLSGMLTYSSTPEEDDPLKFRIKQGSMKSVVNAMGKDVSSNYVILFDETPKYYSITTVEIAVKIKEDAVLQKYYGDKEPIIEFTIDEAEKAKLGDLTLIGASSVGRAQGEIVGEYRVYSDNTARSFRVYDDGIDVTDFFTFTVRQKINNTWRTLSGDTKFTILPRPVTVTVEDASYENTGREIKPVLKYLNANGSRLSATLREDLESRVSISVPKTDYHDGENLVTPVLVGEPDGNYTLTFQAGKINIVYLQNVLTITPLEKTDEIYSGRKFMLSGIMLYKTMRFYKIETANGQQPSHELEISLPVDKELAGDGLVVVTLREDGSSKALSFAQSGLTVVYTDDGAYYVAIAEVQEWFYVIWGAVVVAALVAVYFLVRLIVYLIKKFRKKKGVTQKVKKQKQTEKKAAVAPQPVVAEQKAEEAPQATAEDSMFSDVAVTEESAPAPVSLPEEEVSIGIADDMFTDVAPVEGAPPAEAPTTEAPAPTDDLFTDNVVTEQPIDEFDVLMPVPEEAPAVKEEVSDDKKKKKDKKDKKGKKDKEEDKNKPKGFMPTAFKPKGDKSAAYAPTRSFTEDLFNDDQSDASVDDGSSLLSDSNISDGAIIELSKPASNASDDDELIISRGGGFSLSDSEEDAKKNDDDMM